ncbi:MAG: ABC transporter ATP-binding protein [Bacteroidota bacterium]
MQAGIPIIEVEQLYKRHKGSDEEALKGVDLSICEGENFGLLGPNAAGKTTLISIICGILKFNKGKVRVNGIDVALYPKQIRSIIGLVPQEIALYPNLTVKENIAFFGRMHGISGKTLKNKVDYFLDIVKLEQHQSKYVSRCSGGIKRRVNLVAGLIHNPRIIFLDEPTLGVDAQSRNLIFEFIEQLNKKGATIIYTTHYIKEAENLCHRVMIIDNGNIVTTGSPEELINNHDNCTDLGQVFLKLTGKDLRE